MTPIEKIAKYQKDRNLDNFEMAERLRISESLYDKVKYGYQTHPNIAKRIGELVGLTELETEELMPKCRREHGGTYDPEMYVYKLNTPRPL